MVMSNLQDSATALARLERLQELGYRWDAAARELAENGFGEQVISEGLRVKGAWKAMASSLKAEGQPYEDIVVRLQQMCAGWTDTASALLAAGVAGPDVLRTLLPVVEADQDVWSIVQVVVCQSPDTANFREIAAVLRFFQIDTEEASSHFAGPFGTREMAERRLGIA